MSHPPLPPADCPVCGAHIPAGAKCCPECGADERTGWDEEATRYDGIDLPYQEDDELETDNRDRSSSLRWTLTAVLLLAFLTWFLLGGRF